MADAGGAQLRRGALDRTYPFLSGVRVHAGNHQFFARHVRPVFRGEKRRRENACADARTGGERRLRQTKIKTTSVREGETGYGVYDNQTCICFRNRRSRHCDRHGRNRACCG
ncbi:hypothetical protein D3C72_1294790 [compost metagenome]